MLTFMSNIIKGFFKLVQHANNGNAFIIKISKHRKDNNTPCIYIIHKNEHQILIRCLIQFPLCLKSSLYFEMVIGKERYGC